MKEFNQAVKDHKMQVLQDCGVHRHLRFRREDSIVYWFEIVTWPGVLCIHGDMGTYVFRRLHDMFEFFRGERINPGYWGEKLQAFDKNTGYREFDQKLFQQRVKDHFDTYWEDTDNEEERDECWDEIDNSILVHFDNEWEAYNAVYEFEFRYGRTSDTPLGRRFTFQDFFDGGGTERYTPHFIWCLEAIVWAIHKYDKGESHAA